MIPQTEARFLLEKLPIQNDKGLHEEWIITEALHMEHVFGLPSAVVVNKLLSQLQLFTPIYQRILCTITNMSLLLMFSQEFTAQVPPMELPTIPSDFHNYSSDSSGNEYNSGSTSSNSVLRTPLSSSPASYTFHQPAQNNNNNQTSMDLASAFAVPTSVTQEQFPVSQKSLIMEGLVYLFLPNNRTHAKVIPMQVQVVDVPENRKMIIAVHYQKIASIIYHALTGAVIHSYDTEPVFLTTPSNICDLLPEQSLLDLRSHPPPVRKKLIGRKSTGEQILLSTRTEETAIDPNRPKDTHLTAFTEITRWMIPLVVVAHNLAIVETNTFFQDVFGFTEWKKHALTEFLKKDDRYGFVFTERISNIAIPVKFEKLEPAFTVHNWHKGLAWYAIVPLNLPDCWVRYVPQMEDYIADTQLASEVFSGFSKVSENKVIVKLVPINSTIEFPLLQRLLELRHPNIAVIEGVFLRDYVAFVVTRNPGKSLAKILEAQIYVTPDYAIAVLVRLVSALWFCHHERRIAHGNLSFENVLVDDKWNPYLTGFGARSSIDGNADRFKEDIRQLPCIFLALLSGLAKPPPEFFTGTLIHHSVEIRELVNLMHSPQCTLKDIFSHPAVQNFLKIHQMKPTFY